MDELTRAIFVVLSRNADLFGDLPECAPKVGAGFDANTAIDFEKYTSDIG